jgi:hypothetical protein
MFLEFALHPQILCDKDLKNEILANFFVTLSTGFKMAEACFYIFNIAWT